MPEKPVRVRFAPSPTGPLHIGGVRTALFNYLFARKHNGTFILRIEDTDQVRYIPGAEEYIVESLRWCGIEIDEGVTVGGPYEPYKQSERSGIYREYADYLISRGYAYYAFDTPEELDMHRKQYEEKNKIFNYDATVRQQMKNSLNLPDQEVKSLINNGYPYAIRFKIPENGEVRFNDIVRGEVRIETSILDDKILLKADGLPTYHLANVVDDYLMKISHVIRGEEWLPSTPLHVLLYESFGWSKEMPVFIHMPLTLKPDGKGKLSKRDGDRLGFPVFPLQWTNPETGEVSSGYRESGYLPEAFINILALLGWNPGTDRELFTMDELIQEFTLERITKSGSKFDPEKARWFNHQYILQKQNHELTPWLSSELDKRGLVFTPDYVSKVIGLVKERAFLLTDLWKESWFFFIRPEKYDKDVVSKVWKEDTEDMMRDICDILNTLKEFDHNCIESAIKKYTEEKGIGFGRIMNPLRLAIVGSNQGPGLIQIMEILGREEVGERIAVCLREME
ncbi:MAG: glutamyl-tRNA synthetase [Bacteroides sp. SM23_62_1]|nr:MAG: glutamyl-tRNA synthetase [Bacteroides sp. SM23_62_1]